MKLGLHYEYDEKLFDIRLQYCTIRVSKEALIKWLEGEEMTYTEIHKKNINRKKSINQTVDANTFAMDFLNEETSREQVLNLLIDFYTDVYQTRLNREIRNNEEKRAESIVSTMNNEEFVHLPDYYYDKDAVKGCCLHKDDDRYINENAIPEDDDDDNLWDYDNMMCEGDDYTICGFTKMVQVPLSDESRKLLAGIDVMNYLKCATYKEKLDVIKYVMLNGSAGKGVSLKQWIDNAPKKCSFKVVCGPPITDIF